MYAIVEINGQQFKAEQGKKLFVHHINAIFRLDCSFCPFSQHKNVSHRSKCLILRPKKI